LGQRLWVGPQICGQGGRIAAARVAARLRPLPPVCEGGRRFAATLGGGCLQAADLALRFLLRVGRFRRLRTTRRCAPDDVAVGEVEVAVPAPLDDNRADPDELFQRPVDAVLGPLAQPRRKRGPLGIRCPELCP